MNVLFAIHGQLKGFAKAGKKFVLAKNQTELNVSRTISFLLLLFCLFFYRFIFSIPFLPWRIYLRSLYVLIPLIAFIIKFYKGISISWILNGIKRYWLVFSIFGLVYLLLGYIYYHIISGWKFNLYLLYSFCGIMLVCVGFFAVNYFLIETKIIISRTEHNKFSELSSSMKLKVLFYLTCLILYSPFLIGGILLLIQGLGIVPIGK